MRGLIRISFILVISLSQGACGGSEDSTGTGLNDDTGGFGSKSSALDASNGMPCTTPSWGLSSECASGFCVKGPPGSPCSSDGAGYYCMSSNKSCPQPGSAGVSNNVEYSYGGRVYKCAQGGDLRLADGAICNDSDEPGGLPCASGRCMGDLRGASYCAPVGYDCARPRENGSPYGVNQGDIYHFDGGTWRCEGQAIVPECLLPGCAGVSNGFLCHQNSDCSSDKCEPGPGLDNQRYCVAQGNDCPRPASTYLSVPDDGVDYGATYEYLGHQWLCSAKEGHLIDNGQLNHQGYGAQSWTGVNPLGGGPGYTSYISPTGNGTVVVETAEALRDAIALANLNGAGRIFIEGNAQLNLSDIAADLPMVLQDNVVVASDRGKNGSPGALLYIDPNPDHPGTQHLWVPENQTFVFEMRGRSTRITGLRLRGTDPYHRFVSGCHPYENGIMISGKKALVDNCEISQFNYRAIQMENLGTRSRVAHNYIHHSRRYGLGYGVNVGVTAAYASLAGTAKIQANILDWGRHAIAGSGTPKTRYAATYNLVGEAFTHYVFDMHDGGGNPAMGGQPGVAGTNVKIVANTSYAFNPIGAVNIGAVPETMSVVRRNHFARIYRLSPSDPAQFTCPHPWGTPPTSTTEIAPGGSCAVSQFSPGSLRFSQFQNIRVYDNRHAQDPTICQPTACGFDWACGNGSCVAGTCSCPTP